MTVLWQVVVLQVRNCEEISYIYTYIKSLSTVPQSSLLSAVMAVFKKPALNFRGGVFCILSMFQRYLKNAIKSNMEVRNCMKFSTIKDKKNLCRFVLLLLIFSVLIVLFILFALPVFAEREMCSRSLGSVSAVYGLAALVSLILVAGYGFLIKEKEIALLILFVCVFIVNVGYFALSAARTLGGALLANRVSYVSAFLPLLMLLIIMDVCRIQCHKWFLAVLACGSTAAFLLAASGGSSFGALYYQEVSMEVVDGSANLLKVYGPLHFLYSIYLLVYFGMMVSALFYAIVRKKVINREHAWILISVVLGNIFVWFVEKIIHTDFEFLSLTYVITEVFLLLLYNMMQRCYMAEIRCAQEIQPAPEEEIPPLETGYALPPDIAELFDTFSERAETLTPSERKILKYYAEGREISEVAELAFISIHTVRKHNANIYQKLRVGSRDELMLYLELFRRCGRLEELM